MMLVAMPSCKDEASPVIRIDGPDTLEVARGSATNVHLPTASAFDKEDFDLSDEVVIVGTYDKNRVGYYPISYSVTDHSGNTGIAQCIVHVVHTPTSLSKSYTSSNTLSGCPSTGSTLITNHPNLDHHIYIQRVFGNTGTYQLVMDLKDDGELSLVSGVVFPCAYTATEASGQVSKDGDSIVVNLVLRATGSQSYFPCTVTYVRQ